MTNLLRIIHTTEYHYSEPVHFGVHRVLIIHGNLIALVSFLEPSGQLRIHSDLVVDLAEDRRREPQDPARQVAVARFAGAPVPVETGGGIRQVPDRAPLRPLQPAPDRQLCLHGHHRLGETGGFFRRWQRRQDAHLSNEITQPCKSFAPPCSRHFASRSAWLVHGIGILAGWLALSAVPAVAQAIHPAGPYEDFSPGEAPTAPEAELGEIYRVRPGFLDPLGLDRPLSWMSDGLGKFYGDTGFRLAVAHTMLFGQPAGGLSNHSGAAGDLDIMSSWTLLGRGTENTGRLVATVEYRYDIGGQPPSVIGGQNGTLINTVNAFNDRGGVIRDVYWIQRLYDARLRILIGRADPSDYVGAHLMQNVNNSFVSRHFSTNPAVPFPGHGPMIGVSLRPTDQYYLTGGASNAYSNTRTAGFDSLTNEWDLFTFVEAGHTPSLAGLGAGRYAVGVWHMDSRTANGLPSDHGLTVLADQRLSETVQVFGRYAYSDATLTNVRQIVQAGVGFTGLIGRGEDASGLAVSYAQPRASASQSEKVIEVFHRFQTTRHSQLSLGAQLIIDPGNAPGEDTMGFFYARLRTSF